MKKYIILPLVALIAIACEKTIDFEIPYDPPKITIDTRLRTGELPRAIVGTSVYSLSAETPNLDSLSKVFLYEDNVLVDQLRPTRYNSDIFDNRGNFKPAYYYEGSYRPKADHTYEVRVQREGYQEARGSAYMYEPVNILQTFYDPQTGELIVSFFDPAGQGDHYRVSIFPRSAGNDFSYSMIFGSYDPTIEFFETDEFEDIFDTDGLSFGYAGYLTDEFFDGSLKKLNLVYYGDYEPSPDSMQTGSFDIVIERISRSYYLHERSKSAQTIENPFAEPTPIYGNINNGYGIVGTAAVSRVYIQP
ncbi:MAG: DUF4249 family protein [Owenweeksia sp.]